MHRINSCRVSRGSRWKRNKSYDYRKWSFVEYNGRGGGRKGWGDEVEVGGEGKGGWGDKEWEDDEEGGRKRRMRRRGRRRKGEVEGLLELIRWAAEEVLGEPVLIFTNMYHQSAATSHLKNQSMCKCHKEIQGITKGNQSTRMRHIEHPIHRQVP